MDIKEKVQDIFRDVFDIEDLIINEDMNSDDIDDWDSLSHIQIIVKTEKAFNVKFTVDEINSLEKVGDFIELISKKCV
jgi:acyl carrier protein